MLKYPLFVFTIRENFLKDADDSDALSNFSSLIALVEKMEKNEVQSEYCLCLFLVLQCDLLVNRVFTLLPA